MLLLRINANLGKNLAIKKPAAEFPAGFIRHQTDGSVTSFLLLASLRQLSLLALLLV